MPPPPQPPAAGHAIGAGSMCAASSISLCACAATPSGTSGAGLDSPPPQKAPGQSTASHQTQLLEHARAQAEALRQRLASAGAERDRLAHENAALRQRGNEVQAALSKVSLWREPFKKVGKAQFRRNSAQLF